MCIYSFTFIGFQFVYITFTTLTLSKWAKISLVVKGQIKYLSVHSVTLLLLASHPTFTASSNTDRIGRSSIKSSLRGAFFSCSLFQADLQFKPWNHHIFTFHFYFLFKRKTPKIAEEFLCLVVYKFRSILLMILTCSRLTKSI